MQGMHNPHAEEEFRSAKALAEYVLPVGRAVVRFEIIELTVYCPEDYRVRTTIVSPGGDPNRLERRIQEIADAYEAGFRAGLVHVRTQQGEEYV